MRSIRSVSGLARIGLLLLGMLVLQPGVEGCSCERRHPQSHYCNSDFVVKAKVKSDRIIKRAYTTTDQDLKNITQYYDVRVYDIRISKVFKEARGFSVGGAKKVYTAPDGGTCGVVLQKGTVYLIQGSIDDEGRAHIDLCSEQLLWSTIRYRVRKGYQYVYKRHCGCQIKFCRDCEVEAPKNTCLYNYRADTGYCYLDNSHCKSAGTDKCTWSRTKRLRQCLKEEKERRWSEP